MLPNTFPPYTQYNLPPNDVYGLTSVTHHSHVSQPKTSFCLFGFFFLSDVQQLEQYFARGRHLSKSVT